MAERRQFVRLKTKASVTYQVLASTQTQPTVTKNVGGGGLCLFTSEPLALGTRLSVEIKLPDQERLIVFTGEVVWCEQSPPEEQSKPRAIQIGVKFLEIDPKDHQAVIRHCVANL